MNRFVLKMKIWCGPGIWTSIIPLVALVMLTVLLTRLNPETQPSPEQQLGASKKPSSDANLSDLPTMVPFMEQTSPDVEPVEMSLEAIHRQNKEGFARAEGFGRHRGGTHVLLGDGAVKFITDSIESNQEGSSLQSSSSSGNPSQYGLWGKLGTKAKHPTFDEIAKSSLTDSALNQWKLEQIQLVSLSRFEAPVAYVSADLPPMDQLDDSTIPTRALNEFESIAIDKIMRGQSIVTERTDSTMQMVGAVKATQRCVECHDVQANALLGAFSYLFAIDR